MTKVSMSMRLQVPAERVWEAIGRFNALPEWHPAIEKSTIEGEEGVSGTLRRLSLVGGGEIVERLESHDDGDRVYSYEIVRGPLPVANYHATIRVHDEGDGSCVVEWTSEFEPVGAPEADAVAAIEGVYKAGLENLKRMFGT